MFISWVVSSLYEFFKEQLGSKYVKFRQILNMEITMYEAGKMMGYEYGNSPTPFSNYSR